MKEVFNKALEELNDGNEFVVASVVKTSGSTPQKPGSKLLVKKDGKITRSEKGDSTLGGQPLGSLFLPMPKVTDVNGVAWGKSELNASGLLAMNSANIADQIFSLNGRTPSTSQVNRAQEIAQREAYKQNKEGTSGGGVGVAQAAVNQVNTTIASLLTGQELDQDTYLGLNPLLILEKRYKLIDSLCRCQIVL